LKANVSLTITSLLSILLMTIHVSDDIAHGFEPGGLTSLGVTVTVLVVWLYGTLVLADRRSGYVIILVGSLLGAIVPIIHMKGEGVGKIATTSGGFFFVFTLLALGVTAVFSVILSARGLWTPREGGRGAPRS